MTKETQPKQAEVTLNKDEAIRLGMLTAVGASLAKAFNQADATASNTKKELIITCVSTYDEAQLKIILDAYAVEFKNLGASDSVVKVRKAEFNAVIQAVVKTEVSKDNLKALQAHIGGYNAFIDLARDLKGKVERVSGSKTQQRPKELTEAQSNVVDINIGKASVSQLADIVETASEEINRISAPNMAGMQQLILINSIASTMLKNKDLEKFVLNVADKIAKESESAIEQLRKAMNTTNQAIKATKNNAVAVNQ